jgi:hypothetical protein
MASAIPFWQDDPLAWDRLSINGALVPGRVRVTVKRAPRLDVRKPPKMHSAVLVDQGKPPAEGEIEILLGFESSPGSPFGTAAKQWADWCAMEASIFGGKPGERKAFVVSHPKFQWAKISRVYLEDPTGLDEDGPGARTIKIAWKEYGKIFPASVGEVSAGPGKPLTPVKSTDIRTLAAAKKPSASNTKP